MRQHMMPEERGGEGALLAELHSKGISCDSRTQVGVKWGRGPEVVTKPARLHQSNSLQAISEGWR